MYRKSYTEIFCMLKLSNYKVIFGICFPLLLGGCSSNAPDIECLSGKFLLTSDPGVSIVFSRNNEFALIRNRAHVSGNFRYQMPRGEGYMPGSGQVSFHVNDNYGVGPSAFYKADDPNDVRIFFDNVINNDESSWTVYLGSDDRSNIIINDDLDDSNIRFVGPPCHIA